MRMKSLLGGGKELPKVTQEEFIEILAGDLQFTRAQRNFYMSEIAGRPVKAIDELCVWERSAVIDEFKRIKVQRNGENYRPHRDVRGY